MKFKKLFLTASTTAILLIAQNALAYETYFDLHAQDFSEAKKEGEMIWARYELPKSYVTTNLKHSSTYTTLDDTGFLKAELKEPPTTWGVSVDMSYGFYSKSAYRSIVLTADNGTALIVGLSLYYVYNQPGGVYFNGEKIYKTSTDERLSITINRNDAGLITVNINGSSISTLADYNFPKLQSVEAQLVVDHSDHIDRLNNLTISGNP